MKLFYHTLLFLLLLSPYASANQQDSVRLVELNFGCNTIGEAFEFLRNSNISSNITIKLNYDNYQSENGELSTFGINMNGHSLAIKGRSPIYKSRIVLNKSTAHVLDNYLSNFTLQDMILEGADPNNLGGAIFRQQGNTNNILLKNVELIGGYCGVRATSNINGLYLKDISCKNITNGSFRLGNGDFNGTLKDSILWARDSSDFDMKNVSIDGLTILAPADNSVINGTSKKYNGFLLLKSTHNLDIKNIRAPQGNGGSVISIENSANVNIDGVYLNEFGFNQSWASGISVSKSSNVKISNSLLKTRVNDSHTHTLYRFYLIDGLKFCHNSAIATKAYDRVIYATEMSKIEEFKANLLHSIETPVEIYFRTINGYQAQMDVDWQKEDYNVFVSHGKFYTLFKLGELDNRDYEIRNEGAAIGTASRMEYIQYQNNHNRGRHSVFEYPSNKIKYANSTDLYLKNNSLGRNMVMESICSKDANCDDRTLPSDAGALDSDNYSSIAMPESEPKTSFSIFPNPASSYINVEFEEKVQEGIISILNTSGKEVRVFAINQLEGFTLPIDLKAGYYILRVTQKGDSNHMTFMVN